MNGGPVGHTVGHGPIRHGREALEVISLGKVIPWVGGGHREGHRRKDYGCGCGRNCGHDGFGPWPVLYLAEWLALVVDIMLI